MNQKTPFDEEPTIYRVRLSEEAARQVEEEWLRQAEATGVVQADAWRSGLRAACAGLATLPARCPIASEDDLYPDGTLR